MSGVTCERCQRTCRSRLPVEGVDIKRDDGTHTPQLACLKCIKELREERKRSGAKRRPAAPRARPMVQAGLFDASKGGTS